MEIVQFIFEGSRTNFSFWSKFAYVLVRTGVTPTVTTTTIYITTTTTTLVPSIKCTGFTKASEQKP